MSVPVDGTSSDQSYSRREAADYIAAMASELARLAGRHNLSVLQYLLDMARQEAHSVTIAESGQAGK